MSKCIDVDKAIEVCDWYEHEYSECEEYIRQIAEDIRHLPAADVVEVVRCADCKYQDKGQNECESWSMCKYRSWLYFPVNDEDFCSNGERNEVEE